jgi:hypothetical protein
VVINGVYSYTYTFFVNGAAGGKSAWANLSDERQKKNITEIPGALDKILKLRGVNFDWIDTLNMPSGRQMGFIAQEAEKVIPEVVTNKGGSYLMTYAPVTALLVEGMKEQQKQIEEARKENSELRSELQALKEQIEQIKSAVGYR